MARETRTTKAKAALSGAAPDKQDPKVEKAGGEVDALAPSEAPLEAAGFHEEQTEARKADAAESPVEFHHEEQNKEQLPEKEQLTGTGEPNLNTDSKAEFDPDADDKEHPDLAPEATLVDSAGEQKNSGETAPTAADTAVVTNANQQQKSVGALASSKAPGDQDKTAIAESPVSTPNGERVVTYTTPPRVAVTDVQAEVPDEGEDGSITEEQRAKGFTTPFSAVGPRVPGQPAVTNGIVGGLETVNSGIIPDATVAETDGTYMPAGAPNETYDGTEAPDSLYTGAELNAAPLQAPKPRSFAGSGEAANSSTTNTGGLQITAAPITGDILDEETGKKPSLDSLFVKKYEHGSVMVSTKRLVESTGPQSATLLLGIGQEVSDIEAEKIKARIRG